jgi:hypothetical protein
MNATLTSFTREVPMWFFTVIVIFENVVVNPWPRGTR